MIIKVQPRQSAEDFERLFFYVVQPMKARHVFSNGVASTRTAGIEMTAVARRAPKTKKPVYHFQISFEPSESPEPDEVQHVVSRVLAELGVTDQQWVAAVHYDTDHIHVHVVLNRVSPSTLTALSIRYDWGLLNGLAAQLEDEEGWQSTTHHTDQWRGRGRVPSFVERPSLIEWLGYRLRTQVREHLESPDSTLDGLHHVFARAGVIYEEGARGGILRDAANPDLVVGASAFMRAVSLPQLRKRYGTFEPSRYRPVVSNAYSRQRFDDVEHPEGLYDEFLAARDRERDLIRSGVARRLADVTVTEMRRINNARDKARRLLATASVLPSTRMRAAFRVQVRAERDQTIAAVRDEARRQRRRYRLAPKALTFRQWLYQQANIGDERAIMYLTKIRLYRMQSRLGLEIQPMEIPRHTIDAPTPTERDAYLRTFFEMPA